MLLCCKVVAGLLCDIFYDAQDGLFFIVGEKQCLTILPRIKYAEVSANYSMALYPYNFSAPFLLVFNEILLSARIKIA